MMLRVKRVLAPRVVLVDFGLQPLVVARVAQDVPEGVSEDHRSGIRGREGRHHAVGDDLSPGRGLLFGSVFVALRTHGQNVCNISSNTV